MCIKPLTLMSKVACEVKSAKEREATTPAPWRPNKHTINIINISMKTDNRSSTRTERPSSSQQARDQVWGSGGDPGLPQRPLAWGQ